LAARSPNSALHSHSGPPHGASGAGPHPGLLCLRWRYSRSSLRRDGEIIHSAANAASLASASDGIHRSSPSPRAGQNVPPVTIAHQARHAAQVPDPEPPLEREARVRPNRTGGLQGGNSSGEFCFTLTVTDVFTGGSINRSVKNKEAIGGSSRPSSTSLASSRSRSSAPIRAMRASSSTTTSTTTSPSARSPSPGRVRATRTRTRASWSATYALTLTKCSAFSTRSRLSTWATPTTTRQPGKSSSSNNAAGHGHQSSRPSHDRPDVSGRWPTRGQPMPTGTDSTRPWLERALSPDRRPHPPAQEPVARGLMAPEP
jgi:hypothetical protein